MQRQVLTMTSWQPLPPSQLVFYLLSSSFLSCWALASPVVFLFGNMPPSLPPSHTCAWPSVCLECCFPHLLLAGFFGSLESLINDLSTERPSLTPQPDPLSQHLLCRVFLTFGILTMFFQTWCAFLMKDLYNFHQNKLILYRDLSLHRDFCYPVISGIAMLVSNWAMNNWNPKYKDVKKKRGGGGQLSYSWFYMNVSRDNRAPHPRLSGWEPAVGWLAVFFATRSL